MSESTLKIVKDDPYLSPFEWALRARLDYFKHKKNELEKIAGSVTNFSSGHQYFGIHPSLQDGKIVGWYYREWAPKAFALYLFGDFNGWNRDSHPLQRIENGNWEIFLPYNEFKDSFKNSSKFKVRVISHVGDNDRIPLYANRVVQDEHSKDFTPELFLPEKPYQWKNKSFKFHGTPFIYEAHVGMSHEAQGVSTFTEFTQNILPRIKDAGYNMIQLMGVLEHPYYGSFGYHVSNFFAVSSRFGTPDEFKRLVDKAHEFGIAVIIDLIHSHSVKNRREGINEFDGTTYQFFHEGSKGDHIAWDSKVFDYSRPEVIHFLLSNVRYWLEEYRLDGFRFDGITSMLYHHHGLGKDFSHYGDYFNDVDGDALLYLQLANTLIKEIRPSAITIAEDMSGMPGLCRPIEEGGIGFDYRLSMGIPDYWIKTLKNRADEHWDMFEIYNMLLNRRRSEKHIAYAESHDQAIVGDKTIAMWLMNDQLYHAMRVGDQSHVIDRGIALHKLIRFITILLGGEGYLNFIGNEFGHPEWVDFPRAGNNWSYWYARRQWSLVDDEKLSYKFLSRFDRGMLEISKENDLLQAEPRQLHVDPVNKMIFFEKNSLIFAFSFNPHHSFPNYQINVPTKGKYKIIFNSDSLEFGGFGRIDEAIIHPTYPKPMNMMNNSLFLYLPSRTAMVLKKI